MHNKYEGQPRPKPSPAPPRKSTCRYCGAEWIPAPHNTRPHKYGCPLIATSGIGQVKYVAKTPSGKFNGPVADSEADAIKILEVAHLRVGRSGKWEDIQNAGYKIQKVKIIPID